MSLVQFSGFQAEQNLGHRDMWWRSIKHCLLGSAGHAFVVDTCIIQSR